MPATACLGASARRVRQCQAAPVRTSLRADVCVQPARGPRSAASPAWAPHLNGIWRLQALDAHVCVSPLLGCAVLASPGSQNTTHAGSASTAIPETRALREPDGPYSKSRASCAPGGRLRMNRARVCSGRRGWWRGRARASTRSSSRARSSSTARRWTRSRARRRSTTWTCGAATTLSTRATRAPSSSMRARRAPRRPSP